MELRLKPLDRKHRFAVCSVQRAQLRQQRVVVWVSIRAKLMNAGLRPIKKRLSSLPRPHPRQEADNNLDLEGLWRREEMLAVGDRFRAFATDDHAPYALIAIASDTAVF